MLTETLAIVQYLIQTKSQAFPSSAAVNLVGWEHMDIKFQLFPVCFICIQHQLVHLAIVRPNYASGPSVILYQA